MHLNIQKHTSLKCFHVNFGEFFLSITFKNISLIGTGGYRWYFVVVIILLELPNCYCRTVDTIDSITRFAIHFEVRVPFTVICFKAISWSIYIFFFRRISFLVDEPSSVFLVICSYIDFFCVFISSLKILLTNANLFKMLMRFLKYNLQKSFILYDYKHEFTE